MGRRPKIGAVEAESIPRAAIINEQALNVRDIWRLFLFWLQHERDVEQTSEALGVATRHLEQWVYRGIPTALPSFQVMWAQLTGDEGEIVDADHGRYGHTIIDEPGNAKAALAACQRTIRNCLAITRSAANDPDKQARAMVALKSALDLLKRVVPTARHHGVRSKAKAGQMAEETAQNRSAADDEIPIEELEKIAGVPLEQWPGQDGSP